MVSFNFKYRLTARRVYVLLYICTVYLVLRIKERLALFFAGKLETRKKTTILFKVLKAVSLVQNY